MGSAGDCCGLLGPARGSWRLLMAPGGCSELLGAAGGCWEPATSCRGQFPAAPSNSQQFPAAPSSSQLPAVPSSSQQLPAVPSFESKKTEKFHFELHQAKSVRFWSSWATFGLLARKSVFEAAMVKNSRSDCFSKSSDRHLWECGHKPTLPCNPFWKKAYW